MHGLLNFGLLVRVDVYVLASVVRICRKFMQILENISALISVLL